MPYDELLKWHLYLEKRPYGWREDDRAYKLLCAQGAKVKPAEAFPSLHVIYSRTPLPDDQLDGQALKRSGIFSMMLAAKGGDNVLKDNDD